MRRMEVFFAIYTALFSLKDLKSILEFRKNLYIYMSLAWMKKCKK